MCKDYEDYEHSYIYGDIEAKDLENVIDLEKFNKIVIELRDLAISKCDCSYCNGKTFLNKSILYTVLQEVSNKYYELTKDDNIHAANYRVTNGEVFFYSDFCDDECFICDICDNPYRNEDLEKKEEYSYFNYCKACSSEED